MPAGVGGECEEQEPGWRAGKSVEKGGWPTEGWAEARGLVIQREGDGLGQRKWVREQWQSLCTMTPKTGRKCTRAVEILT